MKRLRVPSALTAFLLALVPLVLGGCGLLLTKGPPVGHESLPHFSCTETTTGPLLDVAWGALNLVGAGVIAANREQYLDPDPAIVSGFVWAVISGISAGVGFERVRKCVAATRQLAERLARAPGAAAAPQVEAPGVQAVLVTPSADTLTVGDHVQLVAQALAASGGAFVDRTFRWSSSNDAVASVSNDGLVTAHAEGAVVVAANTSNVVGTARIVVVSRR
jgi:hypothetical protein